MFILCCKWLRSNLVRSFCYEGITVLQREKVTIPERDEVVKQAKSDHSRPLFPASAFCLRPPWWQGCFHKHSEEVSSSVLWSWGDKELMKRPYSLTPHRLSSTCFYFCLAAEALSSLGEEGGKGKGTVNASLYTFLPVESVEKFRINYINWYYSCISRL